MAALNAIDMFKPTLTINTPTMALDILNHEDFDDFDCTVNSRFFKDIRYIIYQGFRTKVFNLFKSLDFMILGGAPVTPALVNLSNSKLPNSKFLIGYGMTGKTPIVRACGRFFRNHV